jgi:hypothetical protein
MISARGAGEPFWYSPDRAQTSATRLGNTACPPGAIAKEGRRMASGDRLKVYNPMGFPPKVTHKPLAPRLDTLDGKTVYLVDCRFDDSDVFLKQMQAWFSENMPSVKTVFKPISSVYTKDDPATWEEIKANGDAAIVGVGH